jgi:hypothetical protein
LRQACPVCMRLGGYASVFASQHSLRRACPVCMRLGV